MGNLGGTMEKVKLGVRTLIEFVMRSGDIDSAYRSGLRMQEGIKAHQRIQKSYGSEYKSEYFFRNTTVIENIEFEVEGRADGFMEKDGAFLIDEIKSTTRPLESLGEEDRPLHWAQAKCYGYFCCKDENIEGIDIQLTYVNLDEEALTKKFKKHFTFEELEEFYRGLLLRYLEFSKMLVENRKDRDLSLSGLEFPYEEYRPGQRKMSVGVYQAIEEGIKLFVEAPTGIGKTISTIYPSLISMSSLGVEKIFYLTARTSTQREAISALKLLREISLHLKSLVITAKEKICLNDRLLCEPNSCPYAKGHFDRVNEAILDIYSHEDDINRDVVVEYAEKHMVCPHEFQLDISDYCDFVICDYNYFFDPKVYLRRAFDSSDLQTVILVDEAHNLVDRGREMYSAEIRKSEFERLMEYFKEKKEAEEDKKRKAVYKKIYDKAKDCVKEIEKFFLDNGNPVEMATEEEDDEIYDKLKSLSRALDSYLSKEREEEEYEAVRDVFFNISSYCKIEEVRLEGFLNVLLQEKEDLVWKIRAVDPSQLFEAILSRVRASIFFSATLSPLSFYTKLLGGSKNSAIMRLESPFDPDNLKIYQYSLSTRWKDRKNTLDELVLVVNEYIKSVSGNCMVYFPSYAYLKQFEDAYINIIGEDNCKDILVQKSGLDATQRKEIIRKYLEEDGVVGFFVLGGLFSEGIDLPGNSLKGVAVVSVGLPGVSFEQNIIRDYFEKHLGKGYDFAYTYPGMNRVLQAAGRVIRDEKDKGTVLLVDDRFAQIRYRRLYPKHWKGIEYYNNFEELKRILTYEEKEKRNASND